MLRRTFYLKNNLSQLVGVRNYCNNICKNRFEGKVAVVNGATQGIGFSVAKRLAQEGAKVIISSRKKANVDEAVDKLAVDGLKVTGVVCHIGKKEERKIVLDKAAEFGGIDTLILNAGANPVPGPLLDSDEKVFDKVFDTNVKGPTFFVKEALPLIKKGQESSIIFMSTLGAYYYFEKLGMYSMSKISLLSMVKTLANELACHNITVNCVAPGFINTKFADILLRDNSIPINLIPLKRIGQPEDVSGVITFLASKDARFVSGETIVISGGMHSRL